MQIKYAGPTTNCEGCGREVPKKNTSRVKLTKGRVGPKCQVCIMLDNGALQA